MYPHSLWHRARAVSGLLLRAAGLQALALSCCAPVAAASPYPGPTVQEVVEFTRFVQPLRPDVDALRAHVSPDGERAFAVVRKPHVGSDENRYEILLLDVKPEHLATGRQRKPQVLLTLVATRDNNFANPSIQDTRWANSRTLVFRARMRDDAHQVYRLDVLTRRLTQLTFEQDRITAFALSSDLSRVVYAMLVPNPPLKPGARSVVVGNQSFWSVKHGQNDPSAQLRRYQFAVADAGSRKPGRRLGASFPESSTNPPGVNISPDGRWALLHRWEPDRQLEWSQRYPLIAEAMTMFGSALTIDPLSYFSRPASYVARRLVAYRLSDGTEQPVFDAPDDSMPGGSQTRSDRLWMGGGRSAVIAGTHLPAQATPQGGSSGASHVVEYWPETGAWRVVAPLKGRLEAAYRVAGSAEAFVAIDAGTRRHFERQADGGWREVEAAEASKTAQPDEAAVRRPWVLQISEDLNRPPNLVAAGPAGQVVQLTDLNPQFAAATWGTMRAYSWRDTKGRQWDGGLMVPAGHQPGRRYPLVIQTYGFEERRFYLDGSNSSNRYTSGFPGRAFMREGILLLAFPWRASVGAPDGERPAVDAFMDGMQGAVDSLVAQGLVDRDRIGAMGWSATGERILNLVTFTDVPIRAATILDGDANTLFSMTITFGALDGTLVRKEHMNGGAPFGKTLDHWVRNDPSMHTDCVEAALRIETYGPWVLNNWDIYGLLRRQYKPAEMVVIPMGDHALSRPSQRMVSLQGNVDWYRFWLLEQERSERVVPGETPDSLKLQYTRWRQMAELKRADAVKPRCARRAGN